MPVTLAQPLPAIAFSRNKIALALQSDDYLAAAPVNSVNTLEFTTAVAADTSIQLSWTGANATLIAKVTPDDSGFQFPSGDGSNAYVSSLVEVFRANYFIDKYYTVTADITGSNPKLVFIARNPGPDYDMDTFSAGGMNCALLTPGVTDAPILNFAHHVEVWVSDPSGTVFEQAYDANVPLDQPQTGLTTLDIGEEVLHSFLTHETPMLSGLYRVCTNSIRRYYVKYAQYFGETPAIKRVYTSATKVIAMGGLGTQAQILGSIFSALHPVYGFSAQDLFARLGSKNKLVATDQPEWLTYYNLYTVSLTCKLEVTITNEDSTTHTFNPVTGIVIPPNGKFEFAAGYGPLNIGGVQAPGKRPIYYTIRIKEGDTYLSDTYAYVIDYTFQAYPRYFVYENSLGAFQTIATIGKGQAEYVRLKDTGQLSISKGEAAISGEFIETNIFIQDKATVNVGYKRAGQRNTVLLRDLMLSPKVYLYDKGALIPVGLNTDNLKDALDGQNPYANSFEYYPLYQERNFSEAPGLLDDAINDLLTDAGSPLPLPPDDPEDENGTIIVEYGDTHLSVVSGLLRYTAPLRLAGRVNYRIYNTQMNVYFRTEDISYNSAGGSFTILVPGFELALGDQLIIWPYILNPDE